MLQKKAKKRSAPAGKKEKNKLNSMFLTLWLKVSWCSDGESCLTLVLGCFFLGNVKRCSVVALPLLAFYYGQFVMGRHHSIFWERGILIFVVCFIRLAFTLTLLKKLASRAISLHCLTAVALDICALWWCKGQRQSIARAYSAWATCTVANLLAWWHIAWHAAFCPHML